MEFESITDVPVDAQFIKALEDAGASRLLIEMVEVNPEDAGVERNFVRTEVQKYCYWENEISADAIAGNKNLGGGFFQTVWDGDVRLAFGRADSTNKQILEHLGYAVPA